jgi:hypothetical protein
LTRAEIVARARPAVAVVFGKNQPLGTGFLVRPRVLVTNAHVIVHEWVEDLRVKFELDADPGTKALPVRLLYEDKSRDLAFLEVQTDRRPLPLAKLPRPNQGDDITLIGNPTAGKGFIRINAVRPGAVGEPVLYGKETYYSLRVEAEKGDSGSPVLDGAGKVLGVTALRIAPKDKKPLVCCVPIQAVRAALGRISKSWEREAETKKAAARHRLDLLYMRFRVAGAYLALALDEQAEQLAKAMGLAKNRGQTVSYQDQVPRKMLAQWEVAQKMFFTDHKPAYFAVVRSPDLPPDVRHQLAQLRGYYNEMFHLLLKLRRGHLPGAGKRFKLRFRWNQIVDSLGKKLDLPAYCWS